MKDVLSRMTIGPETEADKVLKAYKRGIADRKLCKYSSDCPYDSEAAPSLVLAWRYGYKGRRLPPMKTLH